MGIYSQCSRKGSLAEINEFIPAAAQGYGKEIYFYRGPPIHRHIYISEVRLRIPAAGCLRLLLVWQEALFLILWKIMELTYAIDEIEYRLSRDIRKIREVFPEPVVDLWRRQERPQTQFIYNERLIIIKLMAVITVITLGATKLLFAHRQIL